MCIARSLFASSMNGRFSSSVSSFHSAPEYKHVTILHWELRVIQKYLHRVGLLWGFRLPPWCSGGLRYCVCRVMFRDHAQVLSRSRVKQSKLFDPWIWARQKSCKFDGLAVLTVSNKTNPFSRNVRNLLPTWVAIIPEERDLGKSVVVRRSVSCCVLWWKCTHFTAERWRKSAKLHGVIFRERVDMNSILFDRIAQWFNNVSPLAERVYDVSFFILF